MNRKTIVLTGGGTAGHVMPNLALLPELEAAGFKAHYIGSKGMEKDLVQTAGVPFHQISTGKLRRYFSLENFWDVFKVVIGVIQAFFLMLKLRPAAVFSKGGFVAVPVAIAARALRIPVVSHESDFSPGLATKIIGRFANQLLYSFEETGRYLPKGKSKLVSPAIRRDLFTGDADAGRKMCRFSSDLPILLVMGGSLGAQRLNDALRAILPVLVAKFQIVHLTGRGKKIDFEDPRYCAFEFVGDELRHIFAMTDLVVCRAGANSIFEMLALGIPMLLVPLKLGSRGDQVLNTTSFVTKGWAHAVDETTMTPESLLEAIDLLDQDKSRIKAAQASTNVKDGARQIVRELIHITQ